MLVTVFNFTIYCATRLQILGYLIKLLSVGTTYDPTNYT